ncbi:hypothetical protein L484_021232 [Morus notabilis]|uniref:BURP domain-containing protein n=1 Tax=Morus notabilis TaxID=981085 RepID=W9S3P4_9ROSA|nr:hypothetical protein L484_021232 [Morus notabilis]
MSGKIRRSFGNRSRKSRFGFGVASWNLLFHILVVLLPINNDEIKKGVSQRDPSQMIFFTLKDMKVGQNIPIYFPKKDPSSSPHLLARYEASSIPFSLKELPNLLNFFCFSQDSPQAKAMESTLSLCEIEPIKGETKFCATSLESMLDFVRGAFGLEESFSVVTTTFLTKSMYYCHYQESENKVYKISLGGENGDKVEAVAVCHMDTSHWSRDHVSFRVLRIEPGTFPVCHFFPADHLVWVPTPSTK